MPNWIAFSFQDNLSPTIEHIIFFHDHAIITLVLVTTITLHLLLIFLNSNNFNNFVIEGQEIETVWTILPAILLIFIAIPSINTLYLIEDTNIPSLTINITGHQWYWSYEHSSLNNLETENFIEASNILRLLKTSELTILPINVIIRALVTSSDVIHSWTVPSIGTKIDAIPGRLNQTFLIANRLGIHSGQCSEICGMNHSFMPILLNTTSSNEFLNAINNS